MCAGDGAGGYRLTPRFVTDMMEAFREQRLVHRRFAFQIVLDAARALRALPTIVDVDVAPGARMTVCGDTHGQYYDLLRIFELNGLPALGNPYLFNGGWVGGRGACGVPCNRGAMGGARIRGTLQQRSDGWGNRSNRLDPRWT
jgi:hypothetical protein